MKKGREEEVIATQERRSLRLFCALAVPALLVVLLIFWALRVTGAAWTDADGEEEAIVYTAWDEALSVTVSAPADALPGDASLSVTVLDEDTSDFADALSVMKAWESEMPDEEDLLSAKEAVSLSSVSAAAAAEMTEEEAAENEEDEEDNTLTLSWAEAVDCGTAVLDISFFTKEGEVEPAQPVTVSLKLADLLPENADLSTVRIIHLQKTKEGTVAETVADADGTSGGIFDQKTLTAVFTVDAFSKFAVQWEMEDTSLTIDVKVFDMYGMGFQEDLDTEYTHDDDLLTISDLVDHLHDNSGSAAAHHFEYAQVAYEEPDTKGAGFIMSILGDADKSVITSLSYESSEGKSVYTISYEDGSTDTVKDPELIEIYLFYSVPEVSIDVDLSGQIHEDTPLGSGVVQLVTTSNYFKGLEASDSVVTYDWLMSDNSMGEFSYQIDSGEYAGSIVFTFNGTYESRGSVQSGDQVTVSVTMTNTYTDENGETVTESATATFTLTYKTTSLTVTVYQNDGLTPQPGALVAAVNQQTGETVATGTTDKNGQVSLMLPDGEYTIGVTYLKQTTGGGPVGVARSTGECEVTISFDPDGFASQTGEAEVVLGEAKSDTNGSGSPEETEEWNWDYTTPYYYEHIDVKVAVAESDDPSYTELFSTLDEVLVYDKYGNLLYTCNESGLVSNGDTNDYNCLFDFGDVEKQHSIVVSSEDTIVITYEVEVLYYYLDQNGARVLASNDPTWTGLTDEDGYKVTGKEFKTYTVTLPADGTYPEGEYYQYTDINASQLYRMLFSDWPSDSEKTYSSLEEQNEAFIAAVTQAAEDGTLGDEAFKGIVVDENGAILGIDLSSLTYLQAADYLCDTRTRSGQAGLDFAVDTRLTPQYWEFKILKSYEGYPSDNEDLPTDAFNFELYEVSVNQTEEGWTWTIPADQKPIDTTEVGGTNQEGTSNWSEDASGGYTSTGVMRTDSYETEAKYEYYYIVKEVPTTYTTVDIPAYGIVVWLGKATGTSNNSNGKIEYVSYCRLTETLDEETGERVYASDGNLYTLKTINVYGEDESGDTVVTDTYYALPFVNTYNTLDIYKYTLGSETAGTIGSSLRALQTSDEKEKGAEGLYVKAGSYHVFVYSDDSSITPLCEGSVTADVLVSNLYTVNENESGSEGEGTALIWTAKRNGWYYFTGLDEGTALLFMEESEYDAWKDSWEEGDALPQYTTTSFVHYVIADGLPDAVFTLQTASDEDSSSGTGMYAYFTKSSDGSFVFKGWYDATNLEDKTKLSDELLSDETGYPQGATFFLQSAENGFVSVKGLSSGDFVLQETESPEGYIVLDETIAFSIGEDGTLFGGQSDTGIGVLDGYLNVYNPSESYILPNTGGIGTKKLYALALTLVMTAAAGLLLSCRRRSQA